MFEKFPPLSFRDIVYNRGEIKINGTVTGENDQFQVRNFVDVKKQCVFGDLNDFWWKYSRVRANKIDYN